MSMNENLEARVEKLTDVIKNLEDKPYISAADMNNILNGLVQKVEDTTEENIDKLTNSMSESLIDLLNKKHSDIQKRLDIFEEFVASVEKNVQNPKLEGEITRILNDIEALHSKMNSQELQTEGLLKSFDSFKNLSSSGQISKLSDEIVSISKSYDGIVEVLNNNFEEFLRKVESSTPREELQRIRYYIESVEGNQNVLVSAMNAVNDKQEEIKNLIKQSSAVQNVDRFEQIQTMMNQLNKFIIDNATKADLEIILDRIGALGDFLNEFKRKFEESENSDIRNVFQGQLNNIINKIESLKLGSNSEVNEDIIRLYTSIAEFKDGVYSAINTQLNDVIASMDVQFDKISNSMVNSAIDINETVNNMQGELQKLNSIVVEGINSKTNEIKSDIQKSSNENAITIVNSIKGELSNLVNELSSLNNNDNIMQLAHNIENLKNGFDIDSLIMQVDQIKQSLDFEPIKRELALLNKDEAVNAINNKLDIVLSKEKSDEILSKLDMINESSNLDNVYNALEVFNQKLNFKPLDEKISEIKEYFQSSNLSYDISSIKEKMNLMDNIEEELVTVKNLDFVLSDIKNRIEENFRINQNKINEDENFKNDIKEALKSIYDLAFESSKNDELKNILDEINSKLNELVNNVSIPVDNSNIDNSINLIKDTIELSGSNLENSFRDLTSNVENMFNALKDNLNGYDINTLQSINEVKAEIKESLNKINEGINHISDKFYQTQDNIINPEAILNNVNENIHFASDKISESVTELNSELKHLSNILQDNINSNSTKLYDVIEEKNSNIENLINTINENINLINGKIEASKDEFLNDEIKERINFIGESVNSLDAKFEALDNEKLNEIKEQIELIGEITRTISSNKFDESIELLKQDIKSNNLENIKSIKDTISEFYNNVSSTISSLKFSIQDSSKQEAIQQSFISVFDEFETRLTEKVSALEALIEETSQSDDEKLQTHLIENLDNIKKEVKNSITEVIEQTNNSQYSLLSGIIKASLNESQIETGNLIKQEIEEFSNSLDEKSEITKKELINKFAQIISARDNSEARINLIKTLTDNLNEILNNTILIKSNLENGEMISSVKENLADLSENLSNDFEETKQKIQNGFQDFANSQKENNSEILQNLALLEEKITEKLTNEKETIENFISSTEAKLLAASNNINPAVVDIIDNSIKTNLEESQKSISSMLINDIPSNDKFEEIKNSIIDSVSSSNNDKLTELQGKIDDIVNLYINESASNLKEAIEQNSNEKLSSIINNIETNSKEIISKIEEYVSNAADTSFAKEQLDLIKADIQNKLDSSAGLIMSKAESEANKITNDINESIDVKINNLLDNSKTNREIIENKIDESIYLIQTKIDEITKTSLENTSLTKDVTDDITNVIKNKIDDLIDSINVDFDDNKNKLYEINGLIQNKIDDISNEISVLLENNDSSNGRLNEINDLIQNKINDISNEISSLSANNDENKTRLDELNNTVDSKLNEISNAVASILSDANLTKTRMDEIKDSIQIKTNEFLNDFSSNLNYTNDKIDGINDFVQAQSGEIKNILSSNFDEAYGKIDNINDSIKNKVDEISALLANINENTNLKTDEIKETVQSKIEEFKNSLSTTNDNTISKIDDIKTNIQNKIDEITNNLSQTINSDKNKLDEIKQELNSNLNNILEQLKEEISDVKSTIDNQIAKNEQDADSFVGFGTMMEQKIQNKISAMEILMDDSISKIDSKTAEILNTNNEEYKKSLNEKVDFAIEQLKSDFESKMLDVQKMIDDKVYDIVMRNNEIIKDELKLRADSTIKDITKDFREKIQKIESVFVKNENDDDNGKEAYTLSDVESDIAKIRLSLEKYNKLSNFKEFASRLVELKNINLENAKISRVIGADIMRFDSWLKNTTAKIDVLAAKIEKSEKIKMEDLKTRLIQSEKNQAMPQKLEEAVMSIYKKYRTQETKIEDLINKIETLSQKQTDTFDIKEFIDLFYDTTKKQENIMSRMDNIEDKMDLIQAKIDHIISSCIDE